MIFLGPFYLCSPPLLKNRAF